MVLKLILQVCLFIILFEVVSTRHVSAIHRQYHNAKKLATVEPFLPSKDWQVIKPGQMIPAGLHVRVNFQTGVKEAKLFDAKTREKRRRKARKRLMRRQKRQRKKLHMRKYHRLVVSRRRSNGTNTDSNNGSLVVLRKKRKNKKKRKVKKNMNKKGKGTAEGITKPPQHKKVKGHSRGRKIKRNSSADYAAANELQYYLTLCILISLLGGAFFFVFFRGKLTRGFSSTCGSSKTV